MDTPQSKTSISSINKLSNPSSSNSPAVQDSPVFNYISNLSPIPTVKAEPGAQGFIGLASPPLIFTSPRINSFTSLLNRKLQSAGPNSDFSPVHDKCHKIDGDKSFANPGSEFHSPLMSKEHRASEMKKLGQVAHCSPSGCIDDFLTDPEQCTDSSCKLQSDDASQPLKGSCLKNNTSGSGQDVQLDSPIPLKVKGNKSRISIKVVKNEVRHLIPPSSECQGTVTKLSTDRVSAIYQAGDSSNEASHLERGTLRRCLFDENQQTNIDGSELLTTKDNVVGMHKLADLSSLGTLGIGEMSNHSKPKNGSCASPVKRNGPVAVSKPLGIGLHLNSVVYPRSMDSSNNTQLARVEEKNSILIMTNHSDGKVHALSVGKVPFNSQEGHQNISCSESPSGGAISSDVKLLSNPTVLKPAACTTKPVEKRKACMVTAESNELNLTSPKMKRKKGSSVGDDDNSKRCNCKKTKCLKLYCDCFAAGLYCGESCACQGCFNHPDHEHTVIETRQQIEAKNPLAFAPKVVQPVIDSPGSNYKEVGNLSTPSSARHKRGCNCKKSMCLKKYCECYQGNVGCSDGCRCEGCKNLYGIREGFSIEREFAIRKAADEMREAMLDVGQEYSSVGSNFINSRTHNSLSLTPATPTLQSSDLRKNALKSRLPFRKFLPTLDLLEDMLPSDEIIPTRLRSSPSHSTLLEKSSEHADVDGEKCLDSTEDRLVPSADESESTLAQKLNSDASMIQPSSSTTNDLIYNSKPQLLAGSGLKPMSNSLRWRSSPITPVTQPSAGLEFPDFGLQIKHSDVVEDETPDILKDSSTASKSVKVSSPNKKRVSAPRNPLKSSGSFKSDSPPHNPTESSGSLKICRKYVLRALPTFPSLAPFSKKSCEDKNKICESSDA